MPLLGKAILTLVALVTSIAPYLADWRYINFLRFSHGFRTSLPHPSADHQLHPTPYESTDMSSETHVKNPNWPPHARFHNGQTMTTGLLLGLLVLYYTHLASPPDAAQKRVYLNFVLVLVHLYYVPALSGILYPGADWTDPEFGARPPQAEVFGGMIVAAWVGWWVERGAIKEKVV